MRRAAPLVGRHSALRRFLSELALASDSAAAGEVAAAGPSGLLASAAAAKGAGRSLAERYAALVTAGTLRPDPNQAAVVERLQRLSQDLAEHTRQVEAHRQRTAEYAARRAVLQRQLLPAEEARLLAEEEAAAAAENSRLSGMRSWLSAALGAEEPAQQPQKRSAAQRRAVARARVERQLDEQLGPAPAPPPAPKGVYLHGSVGSGKSLLMDLLASSVAQERAVPHHRRLHFNTAMLELHSRMHAIEQHRMSSEQQQMDAYAAAVREQRQWDMQRLAEQGGSADSGAGNNSGSSSWQQILRLDPLAQKLQRSKLARMAFRRVLRDMMSRTAAEHSAALAAANASIFRHAARALIRNCDTLHLMTGGRSRTSSISSSSSGVSSSSRGEAGSAGSEETEPAETRAGEEGPVVDIHAAPVAASAAAGADSRIAALLCFDELQISDTFSAAALKGLLEALVAEGCVVVATSNRAPDELDSHGLNELMFGHLIETLHSACDVVPLSGETDYRRLMAATAPPLEPLPGLDLGSATGTAATAAAAAAADAASSAAAALEGKLHPQASYFYPLGPAAEAALEQQWRRATGGSIQQGASSAASPCQLAVMFGRQLRVERAASGVAWFRFEELCARPLGAADYLAVSQAFHTVFLEGVPALSMEVRDQARRFITLIDELYNHRARLVCSAATPPDQLFAGADHDEPIIDLEALQFETAVEGSRLRRNLMADGGVAPVAASAAEAAAAAQRLGGVEERFAFARAVSRLYEMQSPLYLGSRPRS